MIICKYSKHLQVFIFHTLKFVITSWYEEFIPTNFLLTHESRR